MWKRVIAIVSALAAIVATVAVAAVASSGSAAKVAAKSAAAGGSVSVVNAQPASTASYWTDARTKAAKPMVRNVGGVSSQAFGSANLDFTRSRITPTTVNKQVPFKGVGKLFFTIPGQGDFQCSASAIANRLIVTAGHCMYGGGFYTNWSYIPGYDGTKAGTAQRPFGTWIWSRGIVPGPYASSSGTVVNNYDFGILELADQAFGGAPLTLFKKTKVKFNTATGHLFDTAVTMLGYPCNFDNCNIMQRNDSSDHRGSGVPAGQNGDHAYEYGSDMTGGSSGGPWVENFGDPQSAAPGGPAFNVRNTIVAVTSYGFTDPAVRILGASEFNADFTSIKNTACAFQAGNC
jgi:V8-like Glu-specific endopeptidase